MNLISFWIKLSIIFYPILLILIGHFDVEAREEKVVRGITGDTVPSTNLTTTESSLLLHYLWKSSCGPNGIAWSEDFYPNRRHPNQRKWLLQKSLRRTNDDIDHFLVKIKYRSFVNVSWWLIWIVRNTSRHVDPEETIDIICVWDIKKRSRVFLFGWLSTQGKFWRREKQFSVVQSSLIC